MGYWMEDSTSTALSPPFAFHSVRQRDKIGSMSFLKILPYFILILLVAVVV